MACNLHYMQVANICKEDGGSPYVCKVNGKVSETS